VILDRWPGLNGQYRCAGPARGSAETSRGTRCLCLPPTAYRLPPTAYLLPSIKVTLVPQTSHWPLRARRPFFMVVS
jgi:hypothetical protein